MSDPSSTSCDPLAHLIHAAGRRETPPAQAYESALAAMTHAWQAKVQRRRWRNVVYLAASIATLGVSAAIGVHLAGPQRLAAEPVAQVVRVIGSVRVRPNTSHDWISLHGDDRPLSSGAVLRTEAAGAVALQLNEVSVRIPDGAEVVFESSSRLRLVRGRLYVDTGAVGSVGRVLVVTDAGSVSDVGTQFEVQYQDGDYRVRVREGEVMLQHGALQERGGAGRQISIDRAGTVTVSAFPANDPAWHWVQALASAPDIDDQPLTVLLAWVARETGSTVRYATPAIERQATTTILHGSIRHLEPLQALDVMLATTDLRYELLSDGTIMIK